MQLKDSFNTAFVSNLCHSIYQAINEGKRILDDLNKELQHHRFGADRETFYFDVEWVPEYQEYWQFLKPSSICLILVKAPPCLMWNCPQIRAHAGSVIEHVAG